MLPGGRQNSQLTQKFYSRYRTLAIDRMKKNFKKLRGSAGFYENDV